MTGEVVKVALGDRAYDIHVGQGALADGAAAFAALLGKGRAAFVADETVWRLHGQAALSALGSHAVVTVEPGEATKCWAQFERVTEALLAAGVGRDGLIIALGGGVVGDLAGFCAASLRRGVRFVQVPTTLLAQVDSSVGGKVAINTRAGKNLVGTFWQPSLVLSDLSLLQSLPAREMRAGYAEVVKYGLLGDRDFFDWLEANHTAVLDGEAGALGHAVATCCRHKAAIVAEDETETGVRALLNLGHTFGHALEAAAGYDGRLLHGEGVAIGMAMAFRFSRDLGLCAGQDADRTERHLKSAGLPTHLSAIERLATSPAEQLSLMRQDKKVLGGRLRLILARGIGEAYLADDIDEATLLSFLEREFSDPPS